MSRCTLSHAPLLALAFIFALFLHCQSLERPLWHLVVSVSGPLSQTLGQPGSVLNSAMPLTARPLRAQVQIVLLRFVVYIAVGSKKDGLWLRQPIK